MADSEKQAQPTFQLVTWDSEQDPANPQNWSASLKWGNVILISVITIITPLASSMFAPAVPDMMASFDDDSSAMASLVVSIYVVGFALGPLLLAPLSEIYGRLPVYHASNLLFLAFTVGCALSTRAGMFVAFRLLAGCVGGTPLVLGGGSTADMIPPEKRGLAMTLWGVGQLFGPVIGPVGGGFLNQAAGWRWIFWVILIVGGVVTAMGTILMRETYAPVILAHKAKKLRKSTGIEYQSQHDIDHASLTKMLADNLLRPLRMLVTRPILLILSVHVAIVYGYLYLVFTTLTYAYTNLYNFTPGEAGLTFLGIGVGMLIGLISVGTASDMIAARRRRVRELTPEDRLPLLIPGALLIPAGLFWYGWALQAHAFWLVPLLGMAVFGAATIATFIPIQMYLIDAFGQHAASALAGLTTVRSVVGATLPLAGGRMYDTLGYGWGNSLLGFVALALAPVPFLFMRYGERLRSI